MIACTAVPDDPAPSLGRREPVLFGILRTLNKTDIAPDPEFPIDDPRVIAVFALSCATGEGLEDFRRRLFSLVPEPEKGRHDG